MAEASTPHKRPVTKEGIALLIEDCERTSAALSMRPTPFQLEQAVNFLVATVPAALRNLEEQLETVRDLNRKAELRCADAFMEARSLKEQFDAAMDALNYAWTIVCNVSEGDWTKQQQEWQDAAARLRDQYHALLDSNPASVPERTDEERERYWRQLEQAQKDTAEWPQFVKDAYPGASSPASRSVAPVCQLGHMGCHEIHEPNPASERPLYTDGSLTTTPLPPGAEHGPASVRHGRVAFGADCICGDPACPQNVQAAAERASYQETKSDG